MSSASARILCLAALLMSGDVQAGYWFGGDCPARGDNQKPIDINRYLGRWYEYEHDRAFYIPLSGHCTTATYSLRDDGDVKVVNKGGAWWPFTFLSGGIEGSARCYPAQGACTVNFGSRDLDTAPTNYQILGTDYDNYSVVYTCGSRFEGLMHREVVWILTRKPNPDRDVIDKAYSIIEEKLPHYWWWFWKGSGWQGDAVCYYEGYKV